MKSALFIFTLATLFTVGSCCLPDRRDDSETICYEFDQRQCGYDEWAELIPLSDPVNARETKMLAYLLSKNIQVEAVNLDPDYHEAVCEACGVCPEEGRFFVRIAAEDAEAFEAMELLNSNAVSCADAF